MDDLLLKCVREVYNSFEGPRDTQRLLNHVRIVIPLEENDFKISYVQGKFKWEIKVKIDDINVFVKNYCRQNNEALRLDTVSPPNYIGPSKTL